MRRLFRAFVVLTLGGAVLLAASSAFYGASGGSVACGDGTAPTRQLGLSGENWRTYCPACVAALRTFGRVEAIDTLEEAARRLAESHPETHIVFGEIGWPNGGRFRPHRTHREGLSVDVMVPMKDGQEIRTVIGNRYGYDVEFDENGRNARGEIDFDALSALLVNFHQVANGNGGRVRRVFFAPDLQSALFAAQGDVDLKSLMRFNKRQSWVRHDDHIHVDFAFPCPG